MKKQVQKKQKAVVKRTHRITVLFSEEEKRVVEEYIRRHRISNRSNWMRELTLRSIFAHLDQDLPMLFSEYEMRR